MSARLRIVGDPTQANTTTRGSFEQEGAEAAESTRGWNRFRSRMAPITRISDYKKAESWQNADAAMINRVDVRSARRWHTRRKLGESAPLLSCSRLSHQLRFVCDRKATGT